MKKKVWKCCGKKYKAWKDLILHRRRRHPEKVAKSKHSSQMNNYGQSAGEFDATLSEQNNVCAICEREAKTVALSQDHTHFIAKLKVVTVKHNSMWMAYNKELGFRYYSHSRKKAKRMVTLKLKRASRRGILCWHCNSALRKFLDNADLLIKAGVYLKKWQFKQNWRYVSVVKSKHKRNLIKTYSMGGLVWVK